jgi:hypothetical protein
MTDKKTVRFSVEASPSSYQKYRSSNFEPALDRFSMNISADIHRKSFERRTRETGADGEEASHFESQPALGKLSPLGFLSLSFRSLGVIFGDIGTSPL